MSFRYFFKFMVLLFFIELMIVPVFASEDGLQALVLVTASDNQLEKLAPGSFRKLFLNVPVSSSGQPLIPLINTSDDLLYEVFLQKVAYMSARHYEHMLIAKAFRTGLTRPEKYSDNAELVKALKAIPGAVSFMFRNKAESEHGIRIVQVLWEERH